MRKDRDSEKEISLDELYKKLDLLEKRGYIQESDDVKLKNLFIILAVCLVIGGIVAYFAFSNFEVLKSGFKSTTDTIIKIMSVDEDVEPEELVDLYVSVDGVNINLVDEENALKLDMESKCSGEKTSLEKSVREQEQKICEDAKILLNTKITTLTNQVKEIQSKFDTCDDALSSCVVT